MLQKCRYFLFIIALGSCLSCIKRPENFNPTPEVPLDWPSLFVAMTDGYGNQSMQEMSSGQFHNSVTTIQIADFAEKVSQQKGQTVLCYNSKTQLYKIVETLLTYDQNNNQKKSSTEYNHSVYQPAIATSWEVAKFVIDICNPNDPSNKEENAICSELEIKDFQGPPPFEVQQQANCGGLAGCQMNFKKISFYRSSDYEDSQGNKLRNKILYSTVVSKDAPYLSRVMEFCQQGIIDIDPKTSIYARICERTRYFEKGQSNQLECPVPTPSETE